jgi:signal transduction histidine kinase
MLLMLDPFRTHQVAINLLSNALKFSKVNDTIEVKLKVTPLEQKDEV